MRVIESANVRSITPGPLINNKQNSLLHRKKCACICLGGRVVQLLCDT